MFQITTSYNVSQRNAKEFKNFNHFYPFFWTFPSFSRFLTFHIISKYFLKIIEKTLSYNGSDENAKN
jgi:hypothetical protein